MPREFYTSSFGPLQMVAGVPANRSYHLLPGAATSFSEQGSGILFLQELRTERHLLQYLIFSFLNPVSFFGREEGGGLQSLLALKGNLQFRIPGGPTQTLSEGQFTLVDAQHAETETIIPGGCECHLVNTYYHHKGYEDWLPLFPALERARGKAKPRFYLPSPMAARHTVLDAIREIMQEHYPDHLQGIHWKLKLQQSLFTQLTQAYTEAEKIPASAYELEMVRKAREIILQDIRQHYANDELARMVGWSESSLQRAFRNEYGTSMFALLRDARMARALELLKQGEQVKAVAYAVGLRPSSFTMEFQKYFGYKATSLRRSK